MMSIIRSYLFKCESQLRKIWYHNVPKARKVWHEYMPYITESYLLVILALLYVCFYRYWEDLIGNHIVNKFLSHFESNLVNDIIFIIAAFSLFILIPVNGWKRIKRQTVFISVITMIIWVYYRWFSHRFNFIPLRIIDSIKYYDIILVFAISKIISFIGGKLKYGFISEVPFGFSLGFTRELPITNKKNDFLERNVFAASAVANLMDTDTSEGSFTFGIDSPWGTGKTSFMNLMKNHLKSYRYRYFHNIIIDFNPWLYAAEKDLATAFFDELSKGLKQYDQSLAKNLIDYSKLLSAFDTPETKIISSLFDLTKHDSSLQEKKSQIIESIKKVASRIFVFIDDLDRLNADEIMEMMKLIRNVSDFPNMYIIAAYDKSYLIKCLSLKMKSGAINFIEKIFQYEDILNPCSNETLKRTLLNQLKKHQYGSSFDNLFESTVMDEHNKAFNSLSNLREVYRLSNRFDSSFRTTGKSINPIDLLLFELFKIKYPNAFYLFESRWIDILELTEQGENHYYKLFQGDESDGHFDYIRYLNSHQEEMNVSEFDIKTIEVILSDHLFKQDNQLNCEYRINNVKWLNRYLNHRELTLDITESEFHSIMEKPIEQVKEDFNDWLNNKSSSLKYRLLNYANKEILSRDELIKLIQAVLDISINRSDYISYDEFYEIIAHLRRYNSNHKYSTDDKNLFFNLLNNYKCSPYICGLLGCFHTANYYLDIPLHYKDLIQLQKRVFYECCRNNNMFEVINCFVDLLGWETHIIDKHIRHYKFLYDKYIATLVRAMKTYSEKNISDFINAVIYSVEDYSLLYYEISPIPKLIWGSWHKFNRYIINLNNDEPTITEFKEFFISYMNNNYRPIPFSFKQIHPKNN